MNHLWNLVKKELRELLTPSSILSILVVAVMFVALGSFMGAQVDDAEDMPKFAYMNLDDDTGTSDYSAYAIGELRSYYDSEGFPSDTYLFDIGTVDENDGSALLGVMDAKGVDTLIVFDGRFSEDVSGSTAGAIRVYWKQDSIGVFSSLASSTSSAIVSMISSYVSERYLDTNTDADPAQIEFSQHPVNAFGSGTFLNGEFHSGATPTDIYNVTSTQTMFIPMIIMIVIVMIGSIVISSMGNEKENKTLETLLTLPISRTTVVSGKILGSAIAGLLFGAMYMAGMYFYMDGLVTTGSSDVTLESLGLAPDALGWAIIALMIFLSIVCALGLCMILGAFAKNYKAAQSMVMPISILAMVPMFMTMLSSFSDMPAVIQGIMFAIPFTHPMMIMENLMFGNTILIVAGLVYMIAFSVATVLITVKLYNSDILLVGFVQKDRWLAKLGLKK